MYNTTDITQEQSNRLPVDILSAGIFYTLTYGAILRYVGNVVIATIVLFITLTAPLEVVMDDNGSVACSACGNAVSQDCLEAVIKKGTKDEVILLCKNCIQAQPAKDESETSAQQTKPETPEPEINKPLEQLVNSVITIVALRVQVRRLHLEEADIALTAVIESVVGNLESEDIDGWKPYGKLRKELDDVSETWRKSIAERTAKEHFDRRLTANRIRGIAGMRSETMNLVALQQAAGREPLGKAQAAIIIGKIILPERAETPDDIPCSTPGCDGVVPGAAVANWKGKSREPKGGWKCRVCRPITNKPQSSK